MYVSNGSQRQKRSKLNKDQKTKMISMKFKTSNSIHTQVTSSKIFSFGEEYSSEVPKLSVKHCEGAGWWVRVLDIILQSEVWKAESENNCAFLRSEKSKCPPCICFFPLLLYHRCLDLIFSNVDSSWEWRPLLNTNVTRICFKDVGKW